MGCPGQKEYADLEEFLVLFTQGFFTGRYNDSNLQEFCFQLLPALC